MFSSENDDLIKRPRDLFDNPLPSGNTLAAEALLQLSLYTGDDGLAATARSNLQAIGSLVDRFPSGVGYGMALSTTLHRGTHELAILGNDREAMDPIYWARWRPHIVLAGADEPTAMVPLLADRPGRPGGLAYLCSGMVCVQPTASTSELASLLEST